MYSQQNITKLVGKFSANQNKLPELNSTFNAVEKFLAKTSLPIPVNSSYIQELNTAYQGERALAIVDENAASFEFSAPEEVMDSQREFELIKDAAAKAKKEKQTAQDDRKAKLDIINKIPQKIQEIADNARKAQEMIEDSMAKSRQGSDDMLKLSSDDEKVKADFASLALNCDRAVSEIEQISKNFALASAQARSAVDKIGANFSLLSGNVSTELDIVGSNFSSLHNFSSGLGNVGKNYSSMATQIESKIINIGENYTKLADKINSQITQTLQQFPTACAQMKSEVNAAHDLSVEQAISSSEKIASRIDQNFKSLAAIHAEIVDAIAELIAIYVIGKFEYSPEFAYYNEVSTNFIGLNMLNEVQIYKQKLKQDEIQMTKSQATTTQELYQSILTMKQDMDYNKVTGNDEVSPALHQVEYRLPFEDYRKALTNDIKESFVTFTKDVTKAIPYKKLNMSSSVVTEKLEEKLNEYCVEVKRKEEAAASARAQVEKAKAVAETDRREAEAQKAQSEAKAQEALAEAQNKLALEQALKLEISIMPVWQKALYDLNIINLPASVDAAAKASVDKAAEASALKQKPMEAAVEKAKPVEAPTAKVESPDYKIAVYQTEDELYCSFVGALHSSSTTHNHEEL